MVTTIPRHFTPVRQLLEAAPFGESLFWIRGRREILSAPGEEQSRRARDGFQVGEPVSWFEARAC